MAQPARRNTARAAEDAEEATDDAAAVVPEVHGVGGFAQQLAWWRKKREVSKRELARRMGYDPSYISHVEAGRHPATEDFARRSDTALDAGGQLWSDWRNDPASRTTSPPSATQAEGLVVEDDFAELSYADGIFIALQRRRLFNAGTEPVTRYLMRISVDRYPGQPERSNKLYRARPLTWDELALTATCDGNPMRWQAKVDRDALKEVWLCFDNDTRRFPLYPGQHATLEYSYRVDEGRWGPWFQRAVRVPTRRLTVQLAFPTDLEPDVWGTETSTTAEATPLRTPIVRSDEPSGLTRFSWSTDDPPMSARYRLEWQLRTQAADTPHPDLRRPSDRMKAAGITQHGDPVLTKVAAPFDLPAEAEEARELIDQLFNAIQRVAEHHPFAKGMGLAAPQIGISRAAAIVQPAGEDTQPIVLLNPTIIDAAEESDEQYEGCLSFFDVRGLVPRSRRVEVKHTALDGEVRITIYHDGLARLVAHEIDHLHGHLYTDRMRPGVRPIPVEEYRGTGANWKHDA